MAKVASLPVAATSAAIKLGKDQLGLKNPKASGAAAGAATPQPEGPIKEAPAANTEVTDRSDEAIANARKRAERLRSNRGRRSLRIDLQTPATETTRSGIAIN